MTSDDVLNLLGGYGRFQMLVYVAVGLIYMSGAWFMFAPIFIGYDPGHHCRVAANRTANDTIPGSIQDEVWVLEQCRMYDEKNTTKSGLDTPVNNTSPCDDGWTYLWDDTGRTSFVSEWNLVCEKDYLAELSTTVYMAGSTVGALLLTPFSDRYGRKWAMLVMFWLQSALGFGLAWSDSIVTFTSGRFFVGLLNMASSLVAYVMMTEVFPSSHRVLPSIYIQCFWSAGVMTFSLLGYLVYDWRHLEMVISLPNFLTVIYACLLPESILWLISKGRLEEAESILRRAIRMNKKSLPLNISTLLKEASKSDSDIADDEQGLSGISNSAFSDESTADSANTGSDYPSNVPDSPRSVLHSANSGPDYPSNVPDSPRSVLHSANTGSDYPSNVPDSPRSVLHSANTGSDYPSDVPDYSRSVLHSANTGSDYPSDVPDSSRSVLHSANSSPDYPSDVPDSSRSVLHSANNVPDSLSSVPDSPSKVLDSTNSVSDFPRSVLDSASSVPNSPSNLPVSSRSVSVSLSNVPVSLSNVAVSQDIQTQKNLTNECLQASDVQMSVCDQTTPNVNKAKQETKPTLNKMFNSRKPTKDMTVFKMFLEPKIRIYSLIMFYLFFVISLGYYGIMFSTPTLNGNRFLNLFISGAIEIPAFVICSVFTRLIGRRIPICVFLLICSTANAALVFLPTKSADGSDLTWLKTSIVMIGKFGISGSYSCIYLYAVEIFPTSIRNHALGMVSFFENVGGICAPIVAYSAKTNVQLPLMVFAVGTVIGGFLVLILPETHKRPLPQTISDVVGWEKSIK